MPAFKMKRFKTQPFGLRRWGYTEFDDCRMGSNRTSGLEESKRRKIILGSKGGDVSIKDKGGTRSGNDRRQNHKPYTGIERRSGRDRRKGFDRRSGLARRRTPNRRSNNSSWDGTCIERRDIFRR